MSLPPDSGSEDDIAASVESPAAKAREAAAVAPVASPAPVAPAARGANRRAWALAIMADLVQWVLMPFFVPGGASPADVALDLVVSGLLIRWCGWHWAFLPSLVAELIPGVDLVPTWTAAVWLATRGKPGPAPRA